MKKNRNLFLNGITIYIASFLITPLVFLINYILGAYYFSISLLLFNALMIFVYDFLINQQLLIHHRFQICITLGHRLCLSDPSQQYHS
jgi:hypothetical protein